MIRKYKLKKMDIRQRKRIKKKSKIRCEYKTKGRNIRRENRSMLLENEERTDS